MAANVAMSELGIATAAMSVGRDFFAKYQNMPAPMSDRQRHGDRARHRNASGPTAAK